MTINNYNSQVPSNIRSVFDSYIPFGSDFVYFTVDNAYGNTQYRAIYRKVGSDEISDIVCTRQADGSYVYTEHQLSGDWSTVTVSRPEYAYTNIKGQGQYYELSSGNTLLIVCVVVLASLSILRTVFGGIRWIHSKRYRV